MSFLQALTSNFIINVGVTSWFSAQFLKLLFTFILTRKVRIERLLGSGGMPSSHSALVCSIVVAMARKVGVTSPLFGLAFCFAAVVIYDAMGVRRAAGEQAKVLNRMIFDFPFFKQKPQAIAKAQAEAEAAKQAEESETPLLPKELKELLGHTPYEVLGGCILGVIIAAIMPIPTF